MSPTRQSAQAFEHAQRVMAMDRVRVNAGPRRSGACLLRHQEVDRWFKIAGTNEPVKFAFEFKSPNF
jgi:hypothetical protein